MSSVCAPLLPEVLGDNNLFLRTVAIVGGQDFFGAATHKYGPGYFSSSEQEQQFPKTL